MGSTTKKNSRKDSWWTSSGNYRTYAGGVISPWENGVIPGTETSVYNQNILAQQAANSYLFNSLVNKGNIGGLSNGVGHGTDASLLRQYELMRELENRNVSNHVSSSTNTSLLGPAPIPSLLDMSVSNARGIEGHRVGNSWVQSQSQLSEYYKRLYMGEIPLRRPHENRNSKKPKKTKKKKEDSEAKNKQEKKSPPSSESSKTSKEKKCNENGVKKEDEEEEEELTSSNSSSKTSEEKTCNENGVKEEDKEKKEENKDSFPVEALQCHICELYSFQSVKSYNNHLKGAAHAKIAEAFHTKNSALKELLRSSYKLYELRKKDKILRETGQNASNMKIESTERKLYERTTRSKSCSICSAKFKKSVALEEHKLSVEHLKNIYSKGQRRPKETSLSQAELKGVGEELRRLLKADEEEDSEDEDLRGSADTASPSDAVVHDLLLLRKSRLKERDDFLPFYDPSALRGLNFLTEKLSFYCNACEKYVLTLDHCRAFSHYENIISWFNKLEEEKRKQKVIKETVVDGTKSLSIQPPKEKGETDAENVSGKTQEGKFVFMEGVINKDKGVTSTESPSHSSADASTANPVDVEDNVQSSSHKDDPKCESEGEASLDKEEEDDDDDDEDDDISDISDILDYRHDTV